MLGYIKRCSSRTAICACTKGISEEEGGLVCKSDKPNVCVCAVYNIVRITSVGVFTGPVSSFSDGGPANVFTSLEIGEKRAGGFIRVRGSETCIHMYIDIDRRRGAGSLLCA